MSTVFPPDRRRLKANPPQLQAPLDLYGALDNDHRHSLGLKILHCDAMQLGERSTYRVVSRDQEDYETIQYTSAQQEDLPRAETIEAYPT